MALQWIKCLLFSFCLSLLSGCQQKETTKSSSSTLKISIESDPQTLDPRLVRDLASTTPIHMLYEGLMRTGKDGQATNALAEVITISGDKKIYTFELRPSVWNDGQQLTAHDFEETWKSILNPQFPSPNAYQLYVIAGAQAAKEGKASLDHVGVRALDDKRLVVVLEQPTPYFLQLTATHFFFPVHSSLRNQSPLGEIKESTLVTNGPFQLEKWNRHNELSAIPNPHYWDKDSVKLERISLITVDNSTALQLFQRGELDWTGSPLSTLSTDALASLKSQNQLKVMPAAGVYLFRFNTEKAPFNHPKMRLAFSNALNRSDLVEHVLQGNQIPALGIIPPSFLPSPPLFSDNNSALAKKLFQEGLEEQLLTINDLPEITLCYSSNERAHKIAQVAQQQWKDVLGITVRLQSCESKVYFDHLNSPDFQVGIGSWFADFRDPITFLDIFKYKNNGTNNTRWENPAYITSLDNSAAALNPKSRSFFLKEAEKVLLKEMPIAPLFFSSYNYVKQPAIKNVYFSELGFLDFKHAYWDITP